MRLAPSGYESFTDIYNGYRWEKPRVKGQPARKIKVKFASLDVMLTAAINIVKPSVPCIYQEKVIRI